MKTSHKNEIAPSFFSILLPFFLFWIVAILFGYIALIKLNFFGALAAMDGEAAYQTFWRSTHFVWLCLCVMSGLPLLFAYFGLRKK